MVTSKEKCLLIRLLLFLNKNNIDIKYALETIYQITIKDHNPVHGNKKNIQNRINGNDSSYIYENFEGIAKFYRS